MNNKTKHKPIKYTDEPLGEVKMVRDFLPAPDELVFKNPKKKKITISVTERSLEFFKKMAQRQHTQYQKLIRQVLDTYSTNYKY